MIRAWKPSSVEWRERLDIFSLICVCDIWVFVPGVLMGIRYCLWTNAVLYTTGSAINWPEVTVEAGPALGMVPVALYTTCKACGARRMSERAHFTDTDELRGSVADLHIRHDYCNAYA
ncbi:hypothetical protein BDV10DRAFT_146486 [Aspergillus recurvatus]